VLAIATVEGTPICGMPVAFAGCRWNAGLGRSVSSGVGLVPLQAVAPATTGALWKNEEGNVVSARNQTHALDGETPKKRSLRTRTRPSLGPETRARHPSSSLSPTPHGTQVLRRAGAGRDEAVRVGIEVGQTCASGRNRPGAAEDRNDAMRGSPRVTAGRGNPSRSCVTRQKRKVVMAIVPARKREPRAQCPYVGMQLQKSAGSILASNKLARSAPQRVAVRVNGGLGRSGVRHESV
jgi:hypothetical protein